MSDKQATLYMSAVYAYILQCRRIVLLRLTFHQMVKAIAVIGMSLDLFIFYSLWDGVPESWDGEIAEQNTTK